MEIRNCPECGKLFTFVRTNLCPECKERMEDQFEIVKQYIQKHPRAHITEISEATEIPEKTIASYIKDGRIVVSDAALESIGLKCESCGAPIAAGRFCDACSKKLADGFSQSDNKRASARAPRLDRDRDKPEWSRSRFKD